MLTPCKKLIDSPFQTPSPIHHQACVKRKPPSQVNKENYAITEYRKPSYDLIPDVETAKQFVWAKKEKRDRKRKHGHGDRKRNLVEECRIELEQLKKRRLEREHLHEQRVKEREDIKKLHLAGEFENWEKEEHAFMLRQAKERTKLRLKAERPEPIDLLVQYKEDWKLTTLPDYPLNLLARLSTSELGDLVADVQTYRQIEGEAACVYWDDVLNVAGKYLNDNDTDGINRRDGINRAVTSDVSKILNGKTSNQLIILRSQINKKLASESIDVSFWESLLDNLTYYLSYARLQEMQAFPTGLPMTDKTCLRNVHHKPEQVSNDKLVMSQETTKPVLMELSDNYIQRDIDVKVTTHETNLTAVKQDIPFTQTMTRHYIRQDIDIFEEKYSPKYLKESEVDKDIIITDPVEDMKKLILARQKVFEMYNRNRQHNDSSDSDDESSFSNEYTLLHQSYSWDTTFRPRKPRYFNRVIAGFVWNRYNRTHYDIDNPPPKTVRGYKFNIFYPDLIDKTFTPVYSITPSDNGLEILRFHAGPPYEDIAFQIVRDEWNKSVKRGYKCSFNGRVLELHFHFKHMCYRR